MSRYEEYLKSRGVAVVLTQKTYPVQLINHLKTLCRHPFLLEASHAAKQRGFKITETDEVEDDIQDLEQAFGSLQVKENQPNKSIVMKKTLSNVFEIAGRDPEAHELLQVSPQIISMCNCLNKVV